MLNSIFVHPDAVRDLGRGLYTSLPEGAPAAPYDRRAAVYDVVVGRSLYHRICWGTSAAAYTRFARVALEAAGSRCFAEVACGSLLFTSALYRERRKADVLLADRSLQMLSRAIKRLSSKGSEVPDGMAVLHSDAATLPVGSGVFESVLSLNLLHVSCDAAAIIDEFSRILTPGRGRLFISSLVKSGRWSDALIAALHRAGEFAAPATPDEIQQRVAGRWGVVETANVEGNMCFLVVRHAGAPEPPQR